MPPLPSAPASPTFIPPIKPPEAICSNSGRAAFWAQEVMDADLVRENLGTGFFSNRASPVAVIETAVSEAAATSSGITFSRHPADPDPQLPPVEDEDHGTAVTSLIASSPIGIAPGIQVGVFERPVVEQVTNDDIYALALRACEQGYRVINVSRGTPNMNGRIWTATLATRLQALAARGCLVIQAAGNHGDHREDELSDPDDAQLTVAALGLAGDRLADMSVWGEVAAPGQGVLVMESPQAAERESDFLRCGGADSPYLFRDGTSYAAPLVAGVAGAALGVLEGCDAFVKFPPATQVKLLNRILRGSMQAGAVNALRAVTMARLWARNPVWPVSTETLVDALALEPDGACTADPLCHGGDESCLRQFRRRSALCLKVPPEHREAAAVAWIDGGRLELAAKQFLLLADEGVTPDSMGTSRIVEAVRGLSARNRNKPAYDVTPTLEFKGLLHRLGYVTDAEWDRELRKDLVSAFAARAVGPGAFEESFRLTLALLDARLLSPALMDDLDAAQLDAATFEGLAAALAASHANGGDGSAGALIRLFQAPDLGVKRFQRLLEAVNMLRGEVPDLGRVYEAVLDSPAFAEVRATEAMGPAFVWFQDNGGPPDPTAFLLRTLAAPGIGKEFLGSVVAAVNWCTPSGARERRFCSLERMERAMLALATHPQFDPLLWETVLNTVENALKGSIPDRPLLHQVLSGLERRVRALREPERSKALNRIATVRSALVQSEFPPPSFR